MAPPVVERVMTRCLCATSLMVLLCVTANAQNLLPLAWKIRFSAGAVPGMPAAGPEGWYDVSLLLSWERQGFSSLDGPGRLACDFVVPPAESPAGLTLTLHLLCQVQEIDLNGGKIHGPIALPPWSAASATDMPVPEGCLHPGPNHLEIAVSDLAYTGGLSHNFCHLGPKPAPGQVDPAVAIDVVSPDHVFADREPRVVIRYRSPAAGSLRVSVRSDFHAAVLDRTLPVPAGEGTIPVPLPESGLRPGFYECTAVLGGAGYEGAVEWFAVAPERIECQTEVPAGFDGYWAEALKELQAVPPDFQVHRLAGAGTGDRDAYTVDMKSLGGVGVRAFYFVPRQAGPHPAILHVPGYGQRYRPADFIAHPDPVAELALCVRGHEPDGPGRFDPPNGPGIWGYKIYDEHEYAYRGIYMDCVRAVDFLRSRPEIDPTRLGVIGGSQGGGLTLATAGLCGHAVAACAYWDPWPCDLRDHRRIRTLIEGELQGFQAFYQNRYGLDQFQRVLDLVDTRSFAPRITCPVLFGTSLFDDDCPPHLGFAAYQLLRTPKRYVVFPEGSHVENSDFESAARAFFQARFGY